MSDQELWDALDGLMAYDVGATDSGIHDEQLRARVKAHLRDMAEDDFRLTLSRFVRDRMLSDEALAEGYGIEEVKEFIEWLSRYMGIDL